MAKGGVHLICLICPPQNLAKLYQKLFETLHNLLSTGISEQDVAKIKNQYIASKIYEKESLESFAFSLGHGFAQNGDIHCEEKFIAQLKKCTAHDVHRGLLDIFQRPLHINVQVPRGTKVKKYVSRLRQTLKKLPPKTTGPRLKAKKSAFDPSTQLIQLKNGINIIHRYNPMTPTFNMYAFIKGGLTAENRANNGLYNILGHLLTKGHKGKNYRDLKFELDEMSSSLNGFSGRDSYGLCLHGLSEYSTRLLDIFFNGLTRPLFSAKEFGHEKKMVLRELLAQQEDPAKQCFKMVHQTLFAGHPYSRPVLGTPTSVKKIQRTSLALHERNLKSQPITIALSGNIEWQRAIDLITPHIEHLPPGRKKTKKSSKFSPLKKDLHRELEREQTHIFIGMRTFPYGHKNDLFIKMLTAHLAGQSSELFVTVRDQKGLCYIVRPIHFAAREAGLWGIYMASGIDKTREAIEAINDILDHHKTQGLTSQEFERVKSMIQGQNLLNIQTNDDYAQIYSIPVLHGLGLDYHHKSTRLIQNSTREEFNRVIRSVLSQKRVMITVGLLGR